MSLFKILTLMLARILSFTCESVPFADGRGVVHPLPARSLVTGMPQMHFGRTESPENASSGRKYRLAPVYRINSVFGALSILDSLEGAIAPTPGYAYDRTV